jgi:hypothetical protein
MVLLMGTSTTTASGVTCGGASAALPPAQCQAWADLYDSTAGASWTACVFLYADPCGCAQIYVPSSRLCLPA